jgi:hypothetical protein
MKKIYYVKEGRRYKPVSEYDSDLVDSFHRGTHLVMVYPGGSSRRYNIDPALAPMIAAGRYAEDAICRAISKASELRPQKTPITEAQQKAWRKLAKEMGDELCTLTGLSVRDCAEAGVQAMQAEAEQLMSNPAVRDAYEQFQLVCKLVKEQQNVHN